MLSLKFDENLKDNFTVKWINKPISETSTQPSSSTAVSDVNWVDVAVVVDGDEGTGGSGGNFDHNDVNTLYILWPWIEKK